MFIYEFKSQKALITKIVISNSYLTIYTNKSSSQELNSMISKFKLIIIPFADNPYHVFCHNPYLKFSALGDSIPHKHLIFPPDVDRLSYLKKIFNFLMNRQLHPKIREKDYHNFIDRLNMEREALHHEKFPDYVQNEIDRYDLQIPYIEIAEIEIVLKLFEAYTNDPYYSHVEAINAYAEKLLKDNWNIVYYKNMINCESTFAKPERELCSFFDSLLKLRNALLAINNNPNDSDLYCAAKKIIDNIMANSNYQKELSFSQHISYIKDFIDNKINVLENSQLYKSSVVSSIVSIGVLLLLENSPFKATILGLAVSAFAALGTKSMARPLNNLLNHSFFKRWKENGVCMQDKNKPDKLTIRARFSH